MAIMTSRLLLVLVLVAGCRDAKGKDDKPALRPAAVVPTTQPEPAPTPVAKTPGDTKTAASKDAKKGDQQDEDWVPAEFKAGQARWKDTGVYLDGKPLAFMAWGELPITLQPTWIKDKVSDRKRPGTNDPGWKWARQRMYKFTDYFKALGVDIKTIKELHVYSSKESQTLIVTQKELQGPLVEQFMFRFGTNTGGKAIAVVPPGLGNKKSGDNITAVMIYVKKKPPTLVRNEGLFLDGEFQRGVPYYGEPIRGGVRIYLDSKLAGIIKRQELDAKKATTDAAGDLHWKLADVFAAQGVDTSKVVEAWVIRGERRTDKFPASELAALTFSASSQAHGGVLLGDGKIKANAIALSTRPIKPEEIPAPTPDDE